MKRKIFVALLGGVLFVACQVQKPDVDTKALLAHLAIDNQMLVSDVLQENDLITIHLQYGATINRPEMPRALDDTLLIAQAMCAYRAGYSVRLVFIDGAQVQVDWHLIKDFCEKALTPDEFIAPLLIEGTG